VAATVALPQKSVASTLATGELNEKFGSDIPIRDVYCRV
jgi:hypothetical protein